MHLSELDNIAITNHETCNLSLKHGLMGKILFYYELAERSNEIHYKHYAQNAMQVLFEILRSNMSVSFMNGLAGIGWCIQYIILKNLDEGDADDILEDLDGFIMEHDPVRIKDKSFEDGLSGIVAYVRARLANKNYDCTPFDKAYLSRLQEACIISDIDFYSTEYEVDCVYSKIINIYASYPKGTCTLWEAEMLSLGSASTQTISLSAYTKEQREFEEHLQNSANPCALLFTQECRAANYGIGTYIEQLVQCLVPAGWIVCVFELDSSNEKPEFTYFKGAGYYKLTQSNTEVSLREYNYAEFVIQHLYKKAGNIICHFNYAVYPLMAECLRNVLHAKSVFTLHFTSWSFDLSGNKNALMRILKKQDNERDKYVYSTFVKEKNFMMKNCDKVIAIAQHSYNMLQDIYDIPQCKLSLIHNGLIFDKSMREQNTCHTIREKYGFEKDDKILVFCGRLDSIKGIVDLIDAFRVLSHKREKTKLVVIGEGNFNACLKFAEGLWTKIVFTGFLPKEKIMEIYKMADLGVVPSVYEEFGYVALEMMTAGLPVIANNTTGLAEMTENGKYGLLYDNESVSENDGFLPLVESVLSGKINVPSADTKVLEEKYSLKVFGRKVLELYNSIL